MFRWLGRTKYAKDKSGATMVYVTLIMAILIGMTGLAVDFSRLYILHTKAQSAADAAAIAAANQLDGAAGSIARAEKAAEYAAATNPTPLIENEQKFGYDDDSAPEIKVTLRFLTGLPASDDTPIDYNTYETSVDGEAEFVEATTEILTHNNLLLPALGILQSKQIQAVAVAGQDAAICRVTPLAICNPAETVGGNEDFDLNSWIGTQLIVKQSGPNSGWAPGNFGFLDPPYSGPGNAGAPDLGHMLASVDGADQCFTTKLNTRTGQVASLRNALNTRFDMYETPHFGNEDDNDDYPPSVNVVKGWVWDGPGANLCNSADDTGAVMGLPRDNVFTDFTEPNNGDTSGGQFGDGNWNCLDYWNTNHPNDDVSLLAADGYTCANNSSAMTRYQMYRWEIDNNEIPGPVTTGNLEEGAPQCHSGAPLPDDEDTDRRMVQFAVMNCIAENVSGNETSVPALAFIRAFMTEPVGDDTSPSGNDFDVFLEVIDVIEAGTNDGPLKEFVEIYR